MSGGVHIVRKRLTPGFVWYIYAWRGGPQVHKSEGPKRPVLSTAIMKAVVDAREKRGAPAATPATLRSLIRQWRSEAPDRPSSPEWEKLAATTKKTWGTALNQIEEKWGDVPLAVFNHPGMTEKIYDWRDGRAATPRAADIGVTVLRCLLAFGVRRSKLSRNAAAGIKSIYGGGDRAEIIWTNEEMTLFCAHAEAIGLIGAADGLRLAAATGLRREDLVTLTKDHVSRLVITIRAKKRSRGKRHVATVVRLPELDAVLDDLSKRFRQPGVTTLLVDNAGAPWTPDRLTKAVGRVRDELAITHVDPETGKRRKKHLHDARGTYATKLMTETEITDEEIGRIMGWSLEDVSRIRHVYVDQSKVVVALAERLRRKAV